MILCSQTWNFQYACFSQSDDSDQDWGKPSAERIKGSDFRKWDQFDAEAEAAKVDDHDEKDEDIKAAAERLAKSRSSGSKDIIDTSGKIFCSWR